MIDSRDQGWPLWAKLVFVALPAAGAAAAGVGASVLLSTALTGPLDDAGVILGAFYDVARTTARYAVFIGAPAAVLALLALLMVGGYGHYPLEASSDEYLPNLLGRVVMGSAFFAGIGLICQLMLAAKLGGLF